MTIIDTPANPPQADDDIRPTVLADGLILPVVTSRCARCAGEIGVMAPWLLGSVPTTPGAILSLKLRPAPGYGECAFCLDCRLASASDEEAKWILEIDRQVRVEAATAGMPRATVWPLYGGGPTGVGDTKWQGVRVWWLALVVSALPPDTSQWPGLRAWWFPKIGGFVFYETLLWDEGKPGVLTVVNNPRRGEEPTPRGYVTTGRGGDLDRLLRLMDVYRRIAPGGRKPDDREDRCREFVSILPDKIRKKRDALEREGHNRSRALTQHELAEAFGWHEDTLRSRLTECGLNWSNIRRRPGARVASQ